MFNTDIQLQSEIITRMNAGESLHSIEEDFDRREFNKMDAFAGDEETVRGLVERAIKE